MCPFQMILRREVRNGLLTEFTFRKLVGILAPIVEKILLVEGRM